MRKKDLKEFLLESNFSYEPVSKEEKELLRNQLLLSRPIREGDFNDIPYYRVKFQEIINLLAIRKVFLYQGFAYFPHCDVIFYIKNRLWKQFNRQLAWTERLLPTALKEQRIEDFLTNIPLVLPIHKNTTGGKGQVHLGNIDTVASINYPLCMRTIHNVLRKNHHLKYDCKMQYGVFLKCLGLSYVDAMEFWKAEFTQGMSEDKYDRKYAYLFKHQYGMVGGRFDYKPDRCDKILEKDPQPGQHHGCPFKHWDVDRLLGQCQEDGVLDKDVKEIRELVVDGKFKEACTVYFCSRHKTIRDDVIQSPNQYFEESYETEANLGNYLDTIFDDFESSNKW